jgi:hypothetical protein
LLIPNAAKQAKIALWQDSLMQVSGVAQGEVPLHVWMAPFKALEAFDGRPLQTLSIPTRP